MFVKECRSLALLGMTSNRVVQQALKSSVTAAEFGAGECAVAVERAEEIAGRGFAFGGVAVVAAGDEVGGGVVAAAGDGDDVVELERSGKSGGGRSEVGSRKIGNWRFEI